MMMRDGARILMQDGADNAAMLEVIRQLAQSVQGMQTGQTQLVERQTEILERLARIEAGKTHEEVAKLEVRVNNHSDRLGANDNMMRIKNCALAGNAVGPITAISATGYTDFAEEGNSTGLSTDVASATTLATPTLGRSFNVTGTTDIYDITPKWKGRRISLTFASTARLIGGTSLRITAPNLTPGQYGTADLIFTGSEWVLLSSSVNDNT